MLALRSCFADVFGGMTNDLALRIASFLPVPERLMVFSGYRGKVFNSVYLHSAVSGTWIQPTRMLSPRIDAACVKLDRSRVLFCGGVNGHPMKPSSQVQDTAQIYDALTNAWTELAPMPYGVRHGCGGALLDGLVYIVGGSYAARAESETRGEPWQARTPVFNVATQEWSQVAAQSTDKVFPAVGAVGGRLVVAGGVAATTHHGANAGRHVEAFDPSRGVWTDCAPMLTTRSACGYCVWQDCLVVCGGRGGAGEPLSSVEVFDGNEWRTLPDMIEARLGPALAVVNGVMHAIGGVSNSDPGWGAHGSRAPVGAEPFTAEVERYDADAREWKPCPAMVAPVAYHACFAAGLAPLYD